MSSLSSCLNRFCQTNLKHVHQVVMFITPPTQFHLWNFPNNDAMRGSIMPYTLKKTWAWCVFCENEPPGVLLFNQVYWTVSVPVWGVSGIPKALSNKGEDIDNHRHLSYRSLITLALYYYLYLHISVLHSNINMFFSFCFQLLECELSLPWKIGESPEECAANYSQHNIFFTAAAAPLTSICRRILKVSVHYFFIHLCNICWNRSDNFPFFVDRVHDCVPYSCTCL